MAQNLLGSLIHILQSLQYHRIMWGKVGELAENISVPPDPPLRLIYTVAYIHLGDFIEVDQAVLICILSFQWKLNDLHITHHRWFRV